MNSPKYNRTYHLPWSKGATNDDKIATDIDNLINKKIIISEKMDGSNTSLEYSGCFARTHSGPPTHLSFDGLKALHASVKYKIPENFQIFGEWLYALHSIPYKALPSYFMMFNVRDLFTNQWLSWEEVEMWAEELKVPTVPVLFKGTVTSMKEFQELTNHFMTGPSCCGSPVREGIVIRVAGSFNDDEFPTHCMKMVRENHVTTDDHWKDQEIIKNCLKNDNI